MCAMILLCVTILYHNPMPCGIMSLLLSSWCTCRRLLLLPCSGSFTLHGHSCWLQHNCRHSTSQAPADPYLDPAVDPPSLRLLSKINRRKIMRKRLESRPHSILRLVIDCGIGGCYKMNKKVWFYNHVLTVHSR